MRKKLFYSLSVAALLASCTSDEMIAPSVDGGEAQLAKRPELGQVVLGEPATRIAITEGSFGVNFQESDKIGACIVDHPDFVNQQEAWTSWSGTTKWYYNEYVNNETKWISDANRKFTDVGGDPKDFYVFDEFISTNYPFTKQGEKWYSPANMVEGNYFFYAPYSENHLTRQKMLAVMPMTQNVGEVEESMYDTKYMKQDVKVSSKAIEDFTNGSDPILIGYKFLDRRWSNSPSVKTYNLYAYPMFTIVNDFNGYMFKGDNQTGTTVATQLNAAKKTITIDKVEVYYAGLGTNPIFWKAPFDFEAVNENLSGNWDAANFTSGTSTIDVLNTSATTAGSPEYGANNYVQDDNRHKLNEPRLVAARRDGFVHTNHITFNVNKTLANGEKYHFHTVMPAGNYGTDLKARVYATIDGAKYVLLTGCDVKKVNVRGDAAVDEAHLQVATSEIGDYSLCDVEKGEQPIQLVRGQHFPLVEYTINDDGSAKGTKAFAGNALTINLAETQAFQLNEVPSADPTYGFTNNTEFITYLEENVQRGLELTEIKNDKQMNKWSTGEFAFADGNQCYIDAQLIKDLYNQTITSGNNPAAPKLTLKTNLPIKGDVEITRVDGLTLTYKAKVDDDTYEYSIAYENTFPTSTTISNGYNIISSGELKGNQASGKNAVIEVTGNVTLKNTTGINLIYVADGAKLTVDTSCGVRIISRGDNEIVIKSGSISNNNNYLKKSVITNDALGVINGSEIGTVKKSFSAWPASLINSNTKINNVTIACSATEIIDQAQINIFSDLRVVDITLTGVTKITSNADVITTNINSITAPAGTQWGHDTKKITVKQKKLGNNWYTSFTNITAQGSVTIVRE